MPDLVEAGGIPSFRNQLEILARVFVHLMRSKPPDEWQAFHLRRARMDLIKVMGRWWKPSPTQYRRQSTISFWVSGWLQLKVFPHPEKSM